MVFKEIFPACTLCNGQFGIHSKGLNDLKNGKQEKSGLGFGHLCGVFRLLTSVTFQKLSSNVLQILGQPNISFRLNDFKASARNQTYR